MDYEAWIGRERRIRIKILQSSPVIRKKHIYRVCQECSEICLCHEDRCPNCGSAEIINQTLGNDSDILSKIRCEFRYRQLNMEESK